MTTEAEALSLPPEQAIRFFAQKESRATARWDDVWKAGHARAFMVAGVQAEDVLAGVRGAVAKALREGTTLAEFRRDLGPLMGRLGWEARGGGYAAWRTRLVYETNLRGAYAAGQYEQQTDPDVLALAPIWRYRHSGAKDPRPEHLAWDGLTLRHDDGWWATHYPPNGWGCDCWVEVLTEDRAAREGGVGTAPPILRRPWRDPASGRTEQVPVGIDPGWDYNPGAAWRELRDVPVPAAPIPPDWPPPAPPLPAPAPAPVVRPPGSPAPPAVLPPVRLPAPVPAPPAIAPAQPPVAAPPGAPVLPATAPPRLPSARPAGEVVPIAGAARVWSFVTAPDASALALGPASQRLRETAGLAATSVLLSADTARKQRAHHPELSEDDYAALAAVIADPALILRQDDRRVLVLVRLGRVYVAVVKAAQDGQEAYVTSFRRVSRRDLRRMLRRFERLHGEPAALLGVEDGE